MCDVRCFKNAAAFFAAAAAVFRLFLKLGLSRAGAFFGEETRDRRETRNDRCLKTVSTEEDWDDDDGVSGCDGFKTRGFTLFQATENDTRLF